MKVENEDLAGLGCDTEVGRVDVERDHETENLEMHLRLIGSAKSLCLFFWANADLGPDDFENQI